MNAYALANPGNCWWHEVETLRLDLNVASLDQVARNNSPGLSGYRRRSERPPKRIKEKLHPVMRTCVSSVDDTLADQEHFHAIVTITQLV